MKFNRNKTLICTFLLFCVSLSKWAGAQPISIALVQDHCDPTEMKAMIQTLKKNPSFSYQTVSIQTLNNASTLKHFTHVWYNRTDTTAFDRDELQLKDRIATYVKEGGNLFLSMEAVPLLNKWSIEKTPFELKTDTVIDEGFGRPLGFHAFKQHPLFDGLLGGAYVSKQKKDQVVRLHGFFNNTVPSNAKVAGIQWTYITFTSSSKLLLEYTLGKGKIIAAGAYLYYAADNYNRQHLNAFTRNVFLYTAGKINNGKTYYWDYAAKTIAPTHFAVQPLHLLKADKWNLPHEPLSMQQNIATKDFYDLVGRKILWMGKMNGGVDEIWMHPFMALRDFNAGIKINGEDTVTWLKNLPSTVTVTPGYLARTYKIKSTTIKEIYTVSFEDPAGVAHFEINGNDVEQLSISYASNLRFMWPYNYDATGSIRYEYNKDINSHIISGQNGALNTLVTYSNVPLRQSTNAKQEQNEVQVTADFNIQNNSCLNIYITGSNNSFSEAASLISKKQQYFSRLFEKSDTYYRNLTQDRLSFETPDTLFNKGYNWALVRTDQFLQTTPGIGTALMAGFGTTARGWDGAQKISGRPGYAWYFGRDGIWSAMAIDSYGDFKMVRDMLDALIRYQDINGKIYHELTSSGVAHYDASDATPLFVILAGHYLRYSGDVQYIQNHWPAIKKAIDFCYSTDTDGDGLIENTNVGHGWIEGGKLFGSHTEFYLAGCWASALENAQYMAAHTGQTQLANQYGRDAIKVKATIDHEFWNQQQQFFYNGKMIDGTYMPDATVLATVPIYLKAVTDSSKIRLVNNRLVSPRFSTDWGIRMIEDSSVNYKAGSYHAGMAWPLYSGWAALSEFKSGNNRSGFQHIMDNLLIYRNWGLGSIEETLNGDVYKPNGVCSHQAWSETMVLQPAIEGMLGLDPDALNHKIQLSPYFPWHWQHASVKNIRTGTVSLDMTLNREKDKTIFIISSNQPVNLNFAPKFPLGTEISKVLWNGKQISGKVLPNEEGCSLQLSGRLEKGKTIISIEHKKGIGALPVIALPEPGDSSKMAKVISETLDNKLYTLSLEGKPGTKQKIEIFCEGQPGTIDGANLISTKEQVLELETELPAGAGPYVKKQIIIHLK